MLPKPHLFQHIWKFVNILYLLNNFSIFRSLGPSSISAGKPSSQSRIRKLGISGSGHPFRQHSDFYSEPAANKYTVVFVNDNGSNQTLSNLGGSEPLGKKSCLAWKNFQRIWSIIHLKIKGNFLGSSGQILNRLQCCGLMILPQK